MSIFAANKKYISLAQQYMHMAKGVQEEQQDIDFGRQLLSNIRQMRIQQAAMDVQSQGREGIMNTGFTAARQGMQTQFTQPYQQETEDYERQEEIAELQTKANQALKKYKKQAKTARTTGYITAIALGAIGGVAGFIGAGALGATSAIALGGAAAGGAVVGGGIAAGTGSAMGADRNYMGGVIQGTTTAATIAGTAGYGAAGGFGSLGKEAVTYSLADGGAKMTVAAVPSTLNYSGIASAAYSVFGRLSKDMEYLAQEPKLSVQLRGFA